MNSCANAVQCSDVHERRYELPRLECDLVLKEVGFLDMSEVSEMDARKSVAKKETIDNIAAMARAVFGNGVSEKFIMEVADRTYKWFALVKSEHSYRKHERVRDVQAVCLYMALKTNSNAKCNIMEICKACGVEVDAAEKSINRVEERLYNAEKTRTSRIPMFANKKLSAEDVSGVIARNIAKLKEAMHINIDTLLLVNKALAIEDIRRKNNLMTGSNKPLHRTYVVAFMACESYGFILKLGGVCKAYDGNITSGTLKQHAINIAKLMPADMWINSHAREQFFERYKTSKNTTKIAPLAPMGHMGDITNTLANA